MIDKKPNKNTETIFDKLRANFYGDNTKTILHVDYDSFFASVEQQANPFLRGKPIAVTGSSLKRGVACAASREAKKFGVKTGTPTFKAKELCPEIIAVKGDGTKYTYIQKESLKIFNKYTDLIEPFSIDEAFLDITNTVKFFGTPEDISKLIKEDIRKAFGNYITCSIGVGPNKLIAKLVSDFNKPNGLFIVNQYNIDDVLKSVKLDDFCGIGPRLTQRLNKMGIETVEQLQQAPLQNLYGEFGNVAGSFLKNSSLGIGFGEVAPTEYQREPKSISHQHTLYKNTKDPKVILDNLRRLTEMVAKRMRNHNVVGKTVHISLRDSERNWYGERKTIFLHTDSGTEIFKVAQSIFEEMKWHKETRLVGLGVSGLINKKNKMLPLFIEDQRDELINTTVDKINDRWGKFTIMPANTMRADQTKHKVSSFLKYN